MVDDLPHQWREIKDLRPEHASVLEFLEAQMLQQNQDPDAVRITLLQKADEFRERELGDAVLGDVPKPAGAGYCSAWTGQDGVYTRTFEDRKHTVHGFEIQIVGLQTNDQWRDALTTERRLLISGDAVLSHHEAQEVAATILGQTQLMEQLDNTHR